MITTSYTDVFVETVNSDCPVSKCVLEAAGCTGTAFVSTNVFIDTNSPYSITATRTNSVGYDETACLKCIVSPINEVDSPPPPAVGG